MRTLRISVTTVLVCLTLSSCVRSKEFTYRAPVIIDESRLRVRGGYYYHIHEPGTGSNGKAIQPIVLWRDGTVAFANSYSDRVVDNSYESAHELFQRRIRDLEGEKEDPVAWGAFRLRGDSISIQVIKQVSSGGAPIIYDVVKYKGEVLNDTTFALTHVIRPAGPQKGSYTIDWIYDFRPFNRDIIENKPASENWTDDL